MKGIEHLVSENKRFSVSLNEILYLHSILYDHGLNIHVSAMATDHSKVRNLIIYGHGTEFEIFVTFSMQYKA